MTRDRYYHIVKNGTTVRTYVLRTTPIIGVAQTFIFIIGIWGARPNFLRPNLRARSLNLLKLLLLSIFQSIVTLIKMGLCRIVGLLHGNPYMYPLVFFFFLKRHIDLSFNDRDTFLVHCRSLNDILLSNFVIELSHSDHSYLSFPELETAD